MVRESLLAADRRRRRVAAQKRIWRVAPVASALGLLTAGAVRLAGLPAAAAAAVLIAGAIALGGVAVLARRSRPVSDADAAAIDLDARMRGELRSAAWFASREGRDPWAEFHVRRAAEHVSTVDWTALYPPVRARRAQLGTALMAAAALALALTAPARPAARSAAAAPPPEVLQMLANRGIVLTPELQQQLEALLAAAARGDAAAVGSLASDADLRDLLDRMGRVRDPELLEALARAMAGEARDAPASRQLSELADRARAAAESGTLPRDLQDALEKLSDQLEIAEPELAKSDEAGAASPAGAPQGGSQAANTDGAQDVSIQFARDMEAAGGAGPIMMSGEAGDQGSAGPPGGGVGGAGSQDAAATGAAVTAALKQELVEASQDNAGDNVDAEMRRRTEHGSATVGFTGSAAGAFDRSRAAAPPPVPEERRSSVQTYFVRPPR